MNLLRVGMIAIAAVIAAMLVMPAPPQALLAFHHTDDTTLELAFSSPYHVRLGHHPHVPSNETDLLAPGDTTPVTIKNGTLQVPLPPEGSEGEYSLVLQMENKRCAIPLPGWLTQCKRSFIEFIRQPPGLLRDRFGFDRPQGYTILGRRNVEVGTDIPTPLGPLTFVGRPSVPLPTIPPIPEVAPYPELMQSAALVEYLWSHHIRGGPTHYPYAQFLSKPLDEKWALLEAGTAAAMCQGMRDMFLHASSGIKELRLRATELYNYAPPFPELITYGHSSSEVWVGSLEKWVLVDAWLGIMIVDRANTPLSAEEIAKNTPADLRIVPLRKEIRRFHTDDKGKQHPVTAYPDQLALSEFTSEDGFTTPGFLAYFRAILNRDYIIRN